jgi:hypothetical protein
VTDKRSESQWHDVNSIDYGHMPEGWGTMTPEAQDEQAQKRVPKTMPLSRNGEDIENSKRSRGERL